MLYGGCGDVLEDTVNTPAEHNMIVQTSPCERLLTRVELDDMVTTLCDPISTTGDGHSTCGMGADTSADYRVVGLIGPPLHHKILAVYTLPSPLTFATSSGALEVTELDLLCLIDGTFMVGFIHSSSSVSMFNVGCYARHMGWSYAQSRNATLITRSSHGAPSTRHMLHADTATSTYFLGAASIVGPQDGDLPREGPVNLHSILGRVVR